MKYRSTITRLVILIVAFTVVANMAGIFSSQEIPPKTHTSIHGEEVTLYGKGLYKHMPQDIAIQGIAQDYITLFIALPLLLIGLFSMRRGSLAGRFLLTGLLLYVLLTYLFYMTMAMYNAMFLVYVAILCCSLFAFLLCMVSFDYDRVFHLFRANGTMRVTCYFLLVNCALIALLWLSIIVPPLLDGTIIPQGIGYFTTLIVQGFDLAIFLPVGVVSAVMCLRRIPAGYTFTLVYVIFLAVLMIALSSKVAFMAAAGQNVIPVVFITPTIAVIAIVCAMRLVMQSCPEHDHAAPL